MNPNEICELCGMEERQHHDSTMSCRGKTLTFSWHPTNRFTPRKEGQVSRPASIADSQSVANKTCDLAAAPPNTLPFNLDKALKGARLVTRCGWEACDLRAGRNSFSVKVKGFTRRLDYDLRGKFFPHDGRDDNSPIDLFLAGEAGKEKAYKEDPGFFLIPDFEDGSTPPPETETQRQAQSEIDRQIEVLKASGEKGAVVECCGHGQNNWEPVPSSFYAAATRPFNWASYDYRIKPAETKPGPRVVWCVFQTDGETAHFQGYSCAPLPVGWTESKFIELNPEVLSALKAAGIEAGKGEV